ncbi:MAG: hypothetical protein KZQ99_21975 [Candidatus Thiodiazotropha sp. (ex Dulcina madagascariensis)]|nr:hypothetical protein [Candidatus Thiodiazotropha sp. (ex Dulcina madagascariensis)]
MDDNIDTLIEKQFLFPKGTTSKNQRELLKQCSLFLLDVTPPCDHSQKKIVWRRFALACMVPLEGLSNNLKNTLGKKEYLKVTPEFQNDDGNGFIFTINANLQISLCDDAIPECLGAANGRFKEQLMADILGWLGRHVTRLGHVALSTC